MSVSKQNSSDKNLTKVTDCDAATAFQIQFTLPVNKPEENVWKRRKGKVVHFEVPINLPDIENVGYRQLIEMAEYSAGLALSTALNNKIDSLEDPYSINDDANNAALRDRKRDRKRNRASDDPVSNAD